MADSSVKAVSPRITLDMDLDEAKALKAELERALENKPRTFGAQRDDALSSVRAELRASVDAAEAIGKGVSYVQEA